MRRINQNGGETGKQVSVSRHSQAIAPVEQTNLPGYPVYEVFVRLLWGALTVQTSPSFVYQGRGHNDQRRKRSISQQRREARDLKRQNVASPLYGWSVR